MQIALLGFILSLALVISMAILYSLARPPHVVEWRVDAPSPEHLMEAGEDMTDTAKARLDRQKVLEIIYFSIAYNDGQMGRESLIKIIDEKWNKNLEGWPEYKSWKISQDFLKKTLANVDFDASGEVFKLASANAAGVPGGYYIVASPKEGVSAGGRGHTRRIIPLADLVAAWRKMQAQPAPETVQDGGEYGGIEGELVITPIITPFEELPDLTEDDFDYLEEELNGYHA